MLFIISLCKSLKTDPFREIFTYATWLKLPNKHPDKLMSATAQLENVYYYGVSLENGYLADQDQIWPWMIC